MELTAFWELLVGRETKLASHRVEELQDYEEKRRIQWGEQGLLTARLGTNQYGAADRDEARQRRNEPGR